MREKTVRWSAALALLALAGACSADTFQERMEKQEKAQLKYGDVAKADAIEVPYLFWGGDVPTFWANGGLETKKDSIFDKMGLKLKLVDGDNFHKQVLNYVGGKTPFVRGTFSMLGQASEALNTNDKTKPVVFLQLTWSAGDHLVARSNVKSIKSLKGKKIAIQQDGPHVGMLDDLLRSADMKWADVNVVWLNQVTGKDSPPDKFKSDTSIDACFAITPDMIGLTGGVDKTGDGKEGTVNGAYVLMSTSIMSRSIADVYGVRSDYYEANKATVEKFVAGYLKATHEIRTYQAGAAKKEKDATAQYKAVLKMARDVYGKDKLPSDEDADGLIQDALFVGLPGNRAFFKDKGNESGFSAKQKHALDLATGEKHAEKRTTFNAVDFDYKAIAKLADLPEKLVDQEARPLASTSAETTKPILTFEITFEPNETVFSEEKYGKDFKKAVEQASLYGNAVVHIRGHADPTKVVEEFVDAGLKKKLLTKSDKDNAFEVKGGGTINFDDPKCMEQVADLIKKEKMELPASTMKLCDDLSKDRARKVHKALLGYADKQKLTLNENQIEPVGLSVMEPVIARPKNFDDTKKNRRVEFRLYPTKPAQTADKDVMLYPY